MRPWEFKGPSSQGLFQFQWHEVTLEYCYSHLDYASPLQVTHTPILCHFIRVFQQLSSTHYKPKFLSNTCLKVQNES